MNQAVNSQKRNNRKSFKVALIIAAAVLIWIAVIAYISINYVFIGGRLINKNEESLDFSGMNIKVSRLAKFENPREINLLDSNVTADEYRTLHDLFPDCVIQWSVPLSSGRFDSDSTEISITSLTAEDLEMIAFFSKLEKITADGIPDWRILSELESSCPEIDLDWEIELGNKYYSSDIQVLELNDVADPAELLEKLEAFTGLKKVSITGSALSIDDQLALVEKYPALKYEWVVDLRSFKVPCETRELDYTGIKGADLDQLIKCAPLLGDLKKIDFTGCGYSNSSMKRVADAYPGADVIWEFFIYGKEVSSLSEEIDLSGMEIEDTSEIENALPYLKNLKKVIMSDCGIGDEEMDALNRKYDDVRFIWTVYFGRHYYLRTDATMFIASLFRGYAENPADLTDENIVPLKYCIDMEALDLGHMYFSNVDFCSEMKNLKWLIIAMSRVNDISGLANCTELFYLEMFLCPVQDLSPLLNCKKLRHLNICQCETEPSLDILAQMTWLERCWMSGGGTFDDIRDRDYVRSDEFLPHTMKRWRGLDHTGDGWRNYPTYFEMRDVFNAPYYPTFWSSNFWRDNPNVIVPDGFIEEHGLEDFDDHSMNWK